MFLPFIIGCYIVYGAIVMLVLVARIAIFMLMVPFKIVKHYRRNNDS